MKKGGLFLAVVGIIGIQALGNIEEKAVSRSFDFANTIVEDFSNPYSTVSTAQCNRDIDNIILDTENDIKNLLSETLDMDISILK